MDGAKKGDGGAICVAHLTSAHPREDPRVFFKQCRSLAAAGYDVTLVVADGLGDERRCNVQILDVGNSSSRLRRMLGATGRTLRQARLVDADIYHLHDPELLPAGMVLKRLGKRVIFDAHEDLPHQIMSKSYLPRSVRRPVSLAAGVFERFVCRRCDAVIAATPAIRDKFTLLNIPAIDVGNFPVDEEIRSVDSRKKSEPTVCYVGSISEIRGFREVVRALSLTKPGVRLNLAGSFSVAGFKTEVETMPGWDRVAAFGQLSRAEIREIYAQSTAGLVTFLPAPNHVASQPNKMFEYMAAGLPVIASDFPAWREIIEGNECGLCVDPRDPTAIAQAIDRLIDNPDLARRLGKNGRQAVQERYTWASERNKLFALYEKLSTDIVRREG